VLILPLFDKVMIGTSDLPIENPDLVRCTEEEVDYFIEMVGGFFPASKSRANRLYSASAACDDGLYPSQKRRSDHARPPHSGRYAGPAFPFIHWSAGNGPVSGPSPSR